MKAQSVLPLPAARPDCPIPDPVINTSPQRLLGLNAVVAFDLRNRPSFA